MAALGAADGAAAARVGVAGAARRRDGGMERRGCGSMKLDERLDERRLAQEHKQQALWKALGIGSAVHETKHLIVCSARVVWGCTVRSQT